MRTFATMGMRAILLLALLGTLSALYAEEALFFVTDAEGDTLFAVYPNGVVIKNEAGDKLFTAESDSIRAYVYDDPDLRRSRGGFAIGGVASTTRDINEYFRVSSDSVRVYLEEDDGTRASRGGFAIGGVASTTRDNEYYFNLERGLTPETIFPSQPRMLWYPAKEAIRLGRVLIISPDSVGVNSMATGFESKALGDYSQALGYQARAAGDYSTAIGYMANAMGDHSFAFGDSARATGSDALAIGFGASAEGVGSYAFGSVPRDSTGAAMVGFPATSSTGPYSMAIGLGATASNLSAISIGHVSQASGYNSLAMGYNTQASGSSSVAIGNSASASASGACALGWYATASGTGSTALGETTTASGNYSLAANRNTTATGYSSVALGYYTQATDDYAFASGRLSVASNNYATAMGYETTASGQKAMAINDNTVASGENSFATGYESEASGNGAVAMGYWNDAVGNASLAVGDENTANGNYSIAMGYYNTTDQMGSVALGQSNNVNAQSAVAVGSVNTVTGTSSFAAGVSNTITGVQAATALGYDNDVTAYASLAAGNRNEASGYASIALGDYNDATGDYSLAVNRYNVASGDYSFAGCSQSEATDDYTLAWGRNCWAHDEGSIALGKRAASNGHTYSFIWGDDGGTAFVNAPANNSFTTRASGGYNLFTNSSLTETASVFITGNEGYLGLGENNPSERLHVAGNAYIDGTIETTGDAEFGAVDASGLISSRYYNSDLTGVDGAWLQANNTNDNYNAMSGVRFQNGSTSNTFKAGVFLTDTASYGRGNLVLANNTSASAGNVQLSDADITIYSNNMVGIGTNPTVAQSYKLTVEGDIAPATDNTYDLGSLSKRWDNIYATNGTIQTSDRRLKTEIQRLKYGIEDLMQLRPVSFEWKDDEEHETHLGLIAQETKEIIPEAVVQENPEDYMGIRYTEIIPVLVSAVQEQQRVIERSNKRMRELEDRIKELESQDSVVGAEHVHELEDRIRTLESQNNSTTIGHVQKLENRIERLETQNSENNNDERVRALEERVAKLEKLVNQLTQTFEESQGGSRRN